MSDKKTKKISFAVRETHALKQIAEANQLISRAKYLLKDYLCGDNSYRYKDQVVPLLAEHMTNTNMYVSIMSNLLLSDNRVTDKKTGEDTIVVESKDFELVTAYLTITAGCENDLETLGISMREH
tara:strand:- start:2417 stop:2791 length:375 start_codon:yes stop_codon:yes gene_type:complete